MKLKFILCLGFAFSIVSCASGPELRSFDRSVSSGMDKDQVLSNFGTPNLTARRNGMDVWQFFFYNGEAKIIKEVHFKEGKVVYRGAAVLPNSNESAKAKDERNSRSNAAFSSSGRGAVSTYDDSESTADKVIRMKQDLENELPSKKTKYRELE